MNIWKVVRRYEGRLYPLAYFVYWIDAEDYVRAANDINVWVIPAAISEKERDFT